MERSPIIFPPHLYIHEWMRRDDITQRALARRLGISEAGMSKLLHGQTQLSHKWLSAIAIALNREVPELYMHPDHLSLDAKVRSLPREKREMAIQFIDALLMSEKL